MAFSDGLTCLRAALQRSGMETPKQSFSTRANVFLADTASPSPAAFATKPSSALGCRVRAGRDGHRDAIGSARQDRDYGGGLSRPVSRARPTGSSGAAKAGKPAYPRYNRGAGEGVAPLPPVAADRDG